MIAHTKLTISWKTYPLWVAIPLPLEYNPKNQQIRAFRGEHDGVVEMILGRLHQELCLAVREIVLNAGIQEKRIRIENE